VSCQKYSLPPPCVTEVTKKNIVMGWRSKVLVVGRL